MHTSQPPSREEAPARFLHIPRRACRTIHRHQTPVIAAAESPMALHTIRPQLPTRTPGSLPFQLLRLAAALAADERDIPLSAVFWPFRHDAVPRLFARDRVVIRKGNPTPFLFKTAFWDRTAHMGRTGSMDNVKDYDTAHIRAKYWRWRTIRGFFFFFLTGFLTMRWDSGTAAISHFYFLL
jgi:hypothetical protein